MRERYQVADSELMEYYTAAVGVGAQKYDSDGGDSFDSWSIHDRMFKSYRRGDMARVDAIGRTLAMISDEHRRTIKLVYEPHGWPPWLASRLSPSWGGGSFVALAATMPRAAEMYTVATKDAYPTPAKVLSWFQTRGMQLPAARLKTDCEAARTRALRAYSDAKKEIGHGVRKAKLEAAAARERLLNEEIEKKRSRELAKFEARLRGAQ